MVSSSAASKINNNNKRIDFDPERRSEEGKNFVYFDGRKEIHAKLGAGDSFYIPRFIRGGNNSNNINELFETMLKEVEFEQMFNFTHGGTEIEAIPRMVAAQTYKEDTGGDNDNFNNGINDLQKEFKTSENSSSSSASLSSPIYRMPGCNQSNIPTSPFSPSVKAVVEKASAEMGQKFNHCVATLFRDKDDSLALHHDKVLDLGKDTLILSISFGAPRPFIFEPVTNKPGHVSQTIILQPGSLLAIGPKTNRDFMHAIPKVSSDVRPRISLSIRTIETFIENENQKDAKVSGKGAAYQTPDYPFSKSYDTIENEIPENLISKMNEMRIAAKEAILAKIFAS